MGVAICGLGHKVLDLFGFIVGRRAILAQSLRKMMIKKHPGFTLVEMSIVLVIIGAILSIAVNLWPGLVQSAKQRNNEAIMQRMELALEGYMVAASQFPCPDTNGDGDATDEVIPDGGVAGNCTSYVGTLPYLSLGLSSGNDVWGNPVRYAVFASADPNFNVDLTDRGDICADLKRAGSQLKDGMHDPAALYTTQSDLTDTLLPNSDTNLAFVIVSGGVHDKDGSGSFFDNLNGDVDPLHFAAPNKIHTDSYDDTVRAVSFATLSGRQCLLNAGGAQENTLLLCSDGQDNDGDGLVDCYDQDCYGLGECPNGPPSEDIQISTRAMNHGVLGGEYIHQFIATGGSGQYYWALDSITPAIPSLSLNYWDGKLTGVTEVCDGDYQVTVTATDQFDATKTASRSFALRVDTGDLNIVPAHSGGTLLPDFIAQYLTFSQPFQVIGPRIGDPNGDDFNWAINWVGAGADNFEIFSTGEDQGTLKKTASSASGNYLFSVEATDKACPNNKVIEGTYSLEVTPSGAVGPYTTDLLAEWRFDECLWDGSRGEVQDSDPQGLYSGLAEGMAVTVGAGKVNRAGYFNAGDSLLLPYVPLNNTSFTFAVWVNLNEMGDGERSLFYQCDAVAVNRCLNIGLRNGRPLISFSSTDAELMAPNALPQTGWHHLFFDYNGANGERRILVDGAVVASDSAQPFNGADGSESGGGSWVGRGIGNMLGYLDEMMIWNRILTPDEISSIYQMRRDPPRNMACYGEPISEYRMETIYPWTGADGSVKNEVGSDHATAAAWGSGSLPTQTTLEEGKVCRAASFTAVDDLNGSYIDLGDPASGRLDPGNRGWSIGLWFKWDGTPGENRLYTKEGAYALRLDANYNRRFLEYRWEPRWHWSDNVGPDIIIEPNRWYHNLITYDGFRQVVYMDGEEVFSQRLDGGAIGSTDTRALIGAHGGAGGDLIHFFSGLIDEFRVYDRALSAGEAEALISMTHDCSITAIQITGFSPASAESGAQLLAGSTGLVPGAIGGSPPYVYELRDTQISGLIMPDLATGELAGQVNVCAGSHNVTLGITDRNGLTEQTTLPVEVVYAELAVSPGIADNFTCSVSGACSKEYTVVGNHLGEMQNWAIEWQGGVDPGAISLTKTGPSTVILAKNGGALQPATNYRYRLSASDSRCSAHQVATDWYNLDVVE